MVPQACTLGDCLSLLLWTHLATLSPHPLLVTRENLDTLDDTKLA